MIKREEKMEIKKRKGIAYEESLGYYNKEIKIKIQEVAIVGYKDRAMFIDATKVTLWIPLLEHEKLAFKTASLNTDIVNMAFRIEIEREKK